MIKEGQFEYPTENWSTGKMRTARRVMEGSGSKEFRELEGLRKEKSQRLSDTGRGDRYAQMSEATKSDANIGAAAGTLADHPVTQFLEKFVKGQRVAQGAYDTVLSPAEEVAFKKWKDKYAPNDSGADYDLRGAFKTGMKPDPDTGHWPDTYKKPNHPTFSDQSIYAKDAPDKAGSWEGEKYVPAGGG